MSKLIKRFNKNAYQTAVGLGLTAAAGSASAAIDISAVTTVLADGVAAVAAIGVAVLSVWATRKVYSMIRG